MDDDEEKSEKRERDKDEGVGGSDEGVNRSEGES